MRTVERTNYNQQQAAAAASEQPWLRLCFACMVFFVVSNLEDEKRQHDNDTRNGPRLERENNWS